MEPVMKSMYFCFCLLGTVLPLSQLGPWLFENGLALPLLIEEAIANRISAFAWLDVLVSGVVVLAFIAFEGQRLQVKYQWAPFLALFTVGASLALPLFLLLREIAMERSPRQKFAC